MSDERRDQIVSLVDEHGYMTVDDLCKKLGASQATLRMDLESLHKGGKLVRLRGVAISKRYGGGIEEHSGDNPALLTRDYMINEKKQIAKCCLRLLTPRDTVFLDTSNTNFFLARELAANTSMPLTTVTNSLDIFQLLRLCPHINTVLCGGDYEMSTNSLVGEHAERFIRGFHANFAFITARGFDIKAGISVYYSRNTAVRRAMQENSAQTVIVSDHSKFGITGVELLCPWEAVDYLITDQPLRPDYQAVAGQHEIRVIHPDQTSPYF